MDIKDKKGYIHIAISGRIDSFNYDHVVDRISTLVLMGKREIALDLQDLVF